MRRPTASSAGSANRRPSTSWASRFICGKSRRGDFLAQAEDPARPHAGEAQGDQGGAAAADAPVRSPNRGLAPASRHRLLRLPRSADKLAGARGVPTPMSTDSGGARFGDAARRTGPHGSGWRSSPTTGSRNPRILHPWPNSASPSNTRGGSRMRESRTYGSVRGAPSNGRPYRDQPQPATSGRQVRTGFLQSIPSSI